MSGDSADPGEIKLELTSESDLMFCYRMLCTEQTFISLSNENQLTASFYEFPQMLTSLIDDVGKAKNGMMHTLVLELGTEDSANGILKFVGDTQFNTVQILHLELEMVDEEDMKQVITFKINALKQKTMLTGLRVRQILDLVKSTNPPLLHEITKGKSATGEFLIPI